MEQSVGNIVGDFDPVTTSFRKEYIYYERIRTIIEICGNPYTKQ